jgi:hypothetical protein
MEWFLKNKEDCKLCGNCQWNFKKRLDAFTGELQGNEEKTPTANDPTA